MNLDDTKKIKQLDKDKVGDSIEALSGQIEQVQKDADLVKIGENYQNVNKIVVHGMGGSNLGARIIESLFSDRLKVSLEVNPGYNVPSYVDENTLYLLSSYSGTTEEVLSVYDEVRKRGSKILGITAHHEKNKLEEMMINDNIPGFIFKPINNPSEQPRMGVGYSIFGMIALFKKAELLDITDEEINNVVYRLQENNSNLNPEVEIKNNRAKQIAKEMQGKVPVLIGAEHLIGNLHTLRNQFCENSKNYANYFTLPELNHYLLESLTHPKSNKKNLVFWFFDSKDYHDRVKRRSELTKEVVKKNKIKVLDYEVQARSKLSQCAEVLQLGSWVTYYLAMLNNINPSLIPWVDWFKEELKK